jgi:RimJ/RimL family protein N-acetyltransferase
VHDDGGLPPVRLRPTQPSDAAFLTALRDVTADDEWDDYDDRPDEMLPSSAYGGGSAVVELPDGTPVGSVSWIQVPHGPNLRSLSWCIGITLLPAYRGRHLGAAAQRLLSDELFARTEANRVEAETDVGNVAEQRSLLHAGFVRDGVARGSNWRRGAWHDMAVYSRLRSDEP